MQDFLIGQTNSGATPRDIQITKLHLSLCIHRKTKPLVSVTDPDLDPASLRMSCKANPQPSHFFPSWLFTQIHRSRSESLKEDNAFHKAGRNLCLFPRQPFRETGKPIWENQMGTSGSCNLPPTTFKARIPLPENAKAQARWRHFLSQG